MSRWMCSACFTVLGMVISLTHCVAEESGAPGLLRLGAFRVDATPPLGAPIELACLRLRNVYVLHMPGELFVEYQLAARELRRRETVCMAAYGDCGAGYIGTEVAYAQGGYETQPSSSNTAPKVERVLMDTVRKLLK